MVEWVNMCALKPNLWPWLYLYYNSTTQQQVTFQRKTIFQFFHSFSQGKVLIVKVVGDRWLCANHPGTKSIVLDIFKSLSVLRSIIIITCETKVLALCCAVMSVIENSLLKMIQDLNLNQTSTKLHFSVNLKHRTSDCICDVLHWTNLEYSKLKEWGWEGVDESN